MTNVREVSLQVAKKFIHSEKVFTNINVYLYPAQGGFVSVKSTFHFSLGTSPLIFLSAGGLVRELSGKTMEQTERGSTDITVVGKWWGLLLPPTLGLPVYRRYV